MRWTNQELVSVLGGIPLIAGPLERGSTAHVIPIVWYVFVKLCKFFLLEILGEKHLEENHFYGVGFEMGKKWKFREDITSDRNLLYTVSLLYGEENHRFILYRNRSHRGEKNQR